MHHADHRYYRPDTSGLASRLYPGGTAPAIAAAPVRYSRVVRASRAYTRDALMEIA